MGPSPHVSKTKPTTYLVTGGGGFLGSAIVRQLVDRGDRVTTFSRGRYPHLKEWGVRHLQGDLNDLPALVQAFQDQTVVIHTAAKPGVWGPYQAYYKANTIGTQNVIAACRQAGVSRLIYTSSPSVVFDGTDMEGVDESVPYPAHYEASYPQTKALAEQAVLEASGSGLPAIILRPHLIWGPGDNHLVPRLLDRAARLRRIGPGTNRVDTVYVDNAAQAHLLAADALQQNPDLSGRIYFISQDEPVPLWEMIDHLLRAGGKGPVSGHISVNTAHAVGAVLETVYKLFRIKSEPPMTRFVARELATSHWFDIRAAKQDLGYQPQVSLEEGLERLAKWLASHEASG